MLSFALVFYKRYEYLERSLYQTLKVCVDGAQPAQ